ncbi:MAG: hypothetical protein KJ548_08890 [Actinobacteria bacterium]|nr:hypothetical protein [Actinomycetota bacterium]
MTPGNRRRDQGRHRGSCAPTRRPPVALPSVARPSPVLVVALVLFVIAILFFVMFIVVFVVVAVVAVVVDDDEIAVEWAKAVDTPLRVSRGQTPAQDAPAKPGGARCAGRSGQPHRSE